jgi:hypothetical protein
MFVYSLRASTLRFFGVIAVSLAVLIALITLVPTHAVPESSQTVSYSYEKVRGEDDAEKFLAQFGWIVDATPVEVTQVTMPDEFDKIFAAYNELQKSQGLNLTKYRGKDVTRYTFAIKNYEGYEGTVWANVLVYRNRVIGGDICSADVSGFVHGFEKK